MTAVTGVSGSGKSSLVGGVLPTVATQHPLVSRVVEVDQKPIGRTPRSNLATYTGMFDAVRQAFAATDEARERGWTAGRFSFNVEGGRCEVCQGEGSVSVELLFLPGSWAPCPECHGARYNAETLEVRRNGSTIADVLGMTVDDASDALADLPAAARASMPCGASASATSGSVSPRRSSPAARPSASSSPPNSSAPGPVTRSTCSTSRPRACTRRTSSSSPRSCSG